MAPVRRAEFVQACLRTRDGFPGSLQKSVTAFQPGYLAGESLFDPPGRIGCTGDAGSLFLVEDALPGCGVVFPAVGDGFTLVGRLFAPLSCHFTVRYPFLVLSPAVSVCRQAVLETGQALLARVE